MRLIKSDNGMATNSKTYNNSLEFHDAGFYEKYVLGKLTEEEETSFEEHLLFCEHCRIQLENTEAFIAGSQKLNLSASENQGKTRKLAIRWSVAASIIVIAGLIIFFNRDIFSPDRMVDKTLIGKEDTSTVIKNNIPKTNKTGQDSSVNAGPINDQLYSEAFMLHPVYESAIENIVRSERLKVIRPVNSHTYSLNDSMIFEWKGTDENLNLVIFDNKGKLISEHSVTSPYILKKELTDGLYYFQLETEEESLYTGKFIVRNTNGK